MNYLLAVQAPAYPIDTESFATESAFARHLVELKQQLGPDFQELILIAPQYTPEEYRQKKDQLEIVERKALGIRLFPAHKTDDSTFTFWTKRAPGLWRDLLAVVQTAGAVHSGLASDIKKPLMAMVNLAAKWKRKPLVFVVDIDFRGDTVRNYKLGRYSFRRYAFNKFVVEPFKQLQIWHAARSFSVVLLKGMGLVRDFGKDRTNVKFFLDTVHDPADVLHPAALAARIARVTSSRNSLKVVYFGRMVAYKGLGHAIEAVRIARAKGANVHLTLIGDGESRPELEQAVTTAGLAEAVTFIPPVRYGDELFRLLDNADCAIATPLLEDTPRAAFDAMARGLPVVAFDTEYFRTLSEQSNGAVALSAREDTSALAETLTRLHRDRSELAGRAASAIAFAAENTQRAWLEKRIAWTLAAMRGSRSSPGVLTRLGGSSAP